MATIVSLANINLDAWAADHEAALLAAELQDAKNALSHADNEVTEANTSGNWKRQTKAGNRYYAAEARVHSLEQKALRQH